MSGDKLYAGRWENNGEPIGQPRLHWRLSEYPAGRCIQILVPHPKMVTMRDDLEEMSTSGGGYDPNFGLPMPGMNSPTRPPTGKRKRLRGTHLATICGQWSTQVPLVRLVFSTNLISIVRGLSSCEIATFRFSTLQI